MVAFDKVLDSTFKSLLDFVIFSPFTAHMDDLLIMNTISGYN